MSVRQGQTDASGQRELGPLTATGIVVANMIGSGIFLTSGIMAEHLPGPLWVLLCWLLGGLIALSGAICFGELATRMPHSGGEYQYLVRLYHPAVGFLSGWTSFIAGFSAPIALSALAYAEYLFATLSHRSGLFQFLPVGSSTAKKCSALLLIGTFTALHYFGRRFGAAVQNLLTVTKLSLIFTLAGLGLLLGRGSWASFSEGLSLDGSGWAFGTCMVMVMYAYSGWNASAYIAGELRAPGRTLPFSLCAGTALVTLIYLGTNVFIFRSVPYEALRGEIAVFERAASWALGDWIGTVFGGIAGIAMLSSLSAYIMLGPRVYHAMARDRLFFPFAARRHPRYGVPGAAILIQGVVASLMVVIGHIEQLLVYVGFALGIFPWLAVASLFVARRKKIGERTAVRAWGFPFVPIFFLISTLALLGFAAAENPVSAGAAFVTILLGAPCYFLWIRSPWSTRSEPSTLPFGRPAGRGFLWGGTGGRTDPEPAGCGPSGWSPAAGRHETQAPSGERAPSRRREPGFLADPARDTLRSRIARNRETAAIRSPTCRARFRRGCRRIRPDDNV